jgi:hypothetical protein
VEDHCGAIVPCAASLPHSQESFAQRRSPLYPLPLGEDQRCGTLHSARFSRARFKIPLFPCSAIRPPTQEEASQQSGSPSRAGKGSRGALTLDLRMRASAREGQPSRLKLRTLRRRSLLPKKPLPLRNKARTLPEKVSISRSWHFRTSDRSCPPRCKKSTRQGLLSILRPLNSEIEVEVQPSFKKFALN